jgi:DNA-binding NtrC family response regulator
VREQGLIVEAGLAHRWSLREIEEQYIKRVLAEVQGDRARAAAILKVHPRTLERRDQRRAKSPLPPDTVSA